MIVEITVTTADLSLVTSTDVVAVVFFGKLTWEAITTPAFICVLGGSNGITFGSTFGDAFIVGHSRVVAVELNLELTARIVLFVAAVVPVDCRLNGGQRANLFRNGIAKKLDRLLAEVGVPRVHDPRSSAVVAVDVDLRFGYRAVQNRCG